MNNHERQPTTEDLQQALRELCLEEAQVLHARLGEAAECLRERNQLGALGALAATEERLRELAVTLKLIQRLSEFKKS